MPTKSASVKNKNTPAAQEPKEAKAVKKVESAESSRKSTREARIAGAKKGREQKATYLQWKAFAIDREKQNYSKLFIIHEKGNWWKMVGHSAILFHYEVAKWIGMSSKLVPDTDYDHISEDGVVNIKDVYLLDKKLAANHINALDLKGEYRIYNIGKKFTEADIAALKKAKVLEWERINKIILPKEIFPTLEAGLRELTTKVYYATRSIDAPLRKVSGDIMLKEVSDLLTEYSLLANKEGGLSQTDYLEQVAEGMATITARMSIIAELRALPEKKIYQILQIISKIKRELEQCRPKEI